MTESEWSECNDGIAMLNFALQRRGIKSDSTQHKMGYRMNSGSVENMIDENFETRLHRFYIACCRNIWKLLPDSESRNGIEIAEKWIQGNATDSELTDCDWNVEGAAFGIDYKTSPVELERWIADVAAIPKPELESVIHPANLVDEISNYDLLKRAAYFAHFAIMYPAINPKGLPPENYHLFLSPELLRQYIQYAA